MKAPTTRFVLWIAFVFTMLTACGGAEERRTTPTIDPPERTAVEDEALRALLVDLAEYHLCDQLEGSFFALPDADSESGALGGRSPSAGRLWVQECETAQVDDRLSLLMAGPGWTWVEDTAEGPMGTSFAVRGQLRFNARVQVVGEIDVSYSREHRLVSLWVTPTDPADANIEPTGAVPVEPEGGWSSFIGAVGGVFGDTVEERAVPMVQEKGSEQLSARLSAGFTFVVDLCTGQADSVVGPLPNGTVPVRPYAQTPGVWLANQRVRLRSDGFDVSGPFPESENPLRVDIEVESGEPVDVRAYCASDGDQVAGAFVQQQSPAVVETLARHRAESGVASYFEFDASECEVVLAVSPTGSADTLYRFRVFETNREPKPLINCE